MKNIIITALCLAIAGGIFLQSLHAGQGQSADGQKIMNERCRKCHDTSRIKEAGHDTAKWEETVERMMKKSGFGPKLSDSERRALVEHLSSI